MSPRWRLAVAWVSLFVIGTDLFIVSPLLAADRRRVRHIGAGGRA